MPSSRHTIGLSVSSPRADLLAALLDTNRPSQPLQVRDEESLAHVGCETVVAAQAHPTRVSHEDTKVFRVLASLRLNEYGKEYLVVSRHAPLWNWVVRCARYMKKALTLGL